MHIRVLLSKYRAYTPCAACGGARLKPDALLWRLGTKEDADRVLDPASRFRPHGVRFGDDVLARCPASPCTISICCRSSARAFFARLTLPAPLDEATELLLDRDPRAPRLTSPTSGLGYLTLDRQSRTLSGGEVQRINLTTALGTSLVNTLFVLDEPSIGLHPRDMGRVIGVMHRLRDAGNSLVVVEHDPQVMLAADRMLDIGPGPGERGGEIVFFGTPDELAPTAARSPPTTSPAASARGARRSHALGHATAARLELLGATEHNLKNIDVAHPAAAPGVRHRRVRLRQVDAGAGRALRGAAAAPRASRPRRRARTARSSAHDRIGDVVMVDQTPIGRTTRSNPASYVGAFDAIRKRFAAGAARPRARLHAGDVQLQLRQRPLPDVRRQRLRARRDAVPLRRLPALPRLRRQALSPRSARGQARAAARSPTCSN